MRNFAQKIANKLLLNFGPYKWVNATVKKRQLDIPSFSLRSENVKGAQLVANRSELIQLLPKKSIVAEIGVDAGNFSQVILDSCMPEKLHLVDIWGSKRYCEKKALAVSKKFSKELQEGTVAITRAL